MLFSIKFYNHFTLIRVYLSPDDAAAAAVISYVEYILDT